jgi:hypothetical protein
VTVTVADHFCEQPVILRLKLQLTQLCRSDMHRLMQQALKECLQGKLLDLSDALSLRDVIGDEFQELLATAAQLRDMDKGRIENLCAIDKFVP